jgi:hypothetical protein
VVLITLILCAVLGLCLLAGLLLNLLLFEGQHIAVDLLGVGRGAEDLQRIVPQGVDPRADVGRVLAGVVTDPEFVTQDHAGDFGPQFFLGVALAAKGCARSRPRRDGWPVQCPSSCSAVA